MEKSIESIWKKGFLKSDALVAPRLNNLYNQKSRDIIEKIKRMMHINVFAIVVFAFAVLIGWYFMGIPYIGAFIFVLLNIFAWYANLQMKKLQDIDRSSSSYQYLLSFNHWLKSSLSNNARIMCFFYPLIFLAAMATIWFSNNNEAVLSKVIYKYFPDINLIGGIPVWWLVGVLAAAAIIGFFGEKIYRWDVNVVYGNVFKKLEEIIADMEELRA
ncbi:hypothetical protein OKW21_006249 [Catalinimonas alkaloidigena]|uniref:hypothetical protein n=1 Tax=Catalinimonas alkaloidigena TaxID=1075417 RepID=UPI002404BA35|nr:hypothetical protein [Catalinimonas alkaloidigena]MDF9800986.1 hypothetical protein [Catalinimonas alkaloidigena]